jgi:hypothetical protein
MFIPGVAEWTFPTEFLELTQEAAQDILAGETDTPSLQKLKSAIDGELKKNGWTWQPMYRSKLLMRTVRIRQSY